MSPWKGHGRPAAVRSVRFKWGAPPHCPASWQLLRLWGCQTGHSVRAQTPEGPRHRHHAHDRPLDVADLSPCAAFKSRRGKALVKLSTFKAKSLAVEETRPCPGARGGLWFRRILSEVRALSGVAGAWLLSHGPGCGHLPAGGRSCPHAIRSSGDDTEWAPIAGL